ncbi:flagellar biosynthesis protein FlhF [Planococcus antarcticus DSM 14505]|uniref:Flagellar biosynthesis protein FlhF n=1 Tax=Planococcus antarcticus DSM 14505 TaxID=1185653 RepID=A0ABN4RB58_9BACL|nr:flagellar biosynthesis protein FlhF [Planococcus antarcticus]ANU09160.1 flagellar biosynthesis protein FlhF [Planococcus antarcticus DSM 14505]
MRLKTYIVSTMTEAIPMIKQELGADALILNTKKIKTGGFLGFFQKVKLEVTAAIDPIATPKSQQVEPLQVQPYVSPDGQKDSSVELINELKNIKQFMVQQMKEEQLPEALRLVKEQLTAQEVAQDIQAELLGKLMATAESNNDQTSEIVQRLAREELIAIIKRKMTKLVVEDPEVICFIGPTGVGKTTTIAKIAADYMLTKDKKVGLITADTYRIAAVEQLKTYGSILNIPVKVVESSEDLTKAIEDFHHCDIILMDTAGRNYQQTQYIEELRRLLPAGSKVQIHLVLSLTAKYEDMKKIIDNFGSVSMDELLLTKRDETSSSGAIINLIYHYGIPIRHIANGQNVPDDILAFTPELAADFIMGEEHHG